MLARLLTHWGGWGYLEYCLSSNALKTSLKFTPSSLLKPVRGYCSSLETCSKLLIIVLAISCDAGAQETRTPKDTVTELAIDKGWIQEKSLSCQQVAQRYGELYGKRRVSGERYFATISYLSEGLAKEQNVLMSASFPMNGYTLLSPWSRTPAFSVDVTHNSLRNYRINFQFYENRGDPRYRSSVCVSIFGRGSAYMK